METRELSEFFAKNGWRELDDDVGDTFFQREIDDLTVAVIPSLKHRENYVRFSLSASLYINELSDISSYISDGIIRNIPLGNLKTPIIKPNELTEAMALDELNIILSWINEFSVECALNEFCSYPADALGIQAIQHISALVMTGNEKQLESYLASIRRSDDLGFIKLIDEDLLERALNYTRLKEVN